MRLNQTLLTLTPALIALGLIALCWDIVAALALYARPWLVGIACLSLLPLGVQLILCGFSTRCRVIHPSGLVLPLSLLMLLALWRVGEEVASWIPALCNVSAWDEVKPKRPGVFQGTASFIAGATGRGNPYSFELSLVTFLHKVYPNERRKADLYIFLPARTGFYIDNSAARFSVTRDKVLEFVRGSDDFPDNDAEAIADELWDVLDRYAQRRDMPRMVYRDANFSLPFIYWVPHGNICIATSALCVPILSIIAWFLAGRYNAAVKSF